MKFERDVVPGVHRIEDAYVNWYLVEAEDGVTVIDAGHPASWMSLHAALDEIGRPVEDVAAVVLTHGHFDHVGFAERARRELRVPVFAPDGDRALVARPWHYRHEKNRLRQALEHPSFAWVFTRMGAAGALTVKGVEAFTVYSPGDRLPVPGSPLALATPGHTDGHCSLLLDDRGILVAGDAIVTFNPYTGGHGPQIVSGAATADSNRALDSLTAIGACPVACLATGHGPVWRGSPAQAVALARMAGPS